MEFCPLKTANFSFADLKAGFCAHDLAEFYGVSIDTIRRWKHGKQVTPGTARLTLARFAGDLSAIYGPAWQDFQESPQELTIPGFKRGFGPGELRESFWRLQKLGSLRHKVQFLEREMERAEETAQAEQHRAE